ncbi:MAG: hypothetical protein U5J62_05460 [Desulfurivibrio sp.]|nr:hypothetical protein [Desulfurivibrio sp.]
MLEGEDRKTTHQGIGQWYPAVVGPMIRQLGEILPDGGEHAIGVEQFAHGGFSFPGQAFNGFDEVLFAACLHGDLLCKWLKLHRKIASRFNRLCQAKNTPRHKFILLKYRNNFTLYP